MILVWKRRGPGLGIMADGQEHRYYVYRMTKGANSWTLKILPLYDGPGGLRLARSGPAQYNEFNDSQAITKALAEAYEDEPENVANGQSRMNRALHRAYRS
jgi:hypothetical protein